MRLAVLLLPWEPCLDIRSFCIRLSDVEGTLLELLIGDLEGLHEVLLESCEEEVLIVRGLSCRE